MLAKTYDALVVAGAPEDKAREAEEEIAGFENRLTRIETDIAIIKSKLETEVATKTWVLSLIVAQTGAILGGVASLLKLLH